MVKNYSDFLNVLSESGFSMGGGNSEGIFAAVPWNWNENPSYETNVKWHTGETEFDPWEWRMRVLNEKREIAYAKLFFKKSGYITKEWYPYFLAARENSGDFIQDLQKGKISFDARKIFEAVKDNGVLPLHILKTVSGFSKEENSAFERALVELQMKMYITMCGKQQKVSLSGEEYGWSSTVFCTVETFFGKEIFEAAAKIDKKEAAEKIAAQILKLNPLADSKKITKFIKG